MLRNHRLALFLSLALGGTCAWTLARTDAPRLVADAELADALALPVASAFAVPLDPDTSTRNVPWRIAKNCDLGDGRVIASDSPDYADCQRAMEGRRQQAGRAAPGPAPKQTPPRIVPNTSSDPIGVPLRSNSP